MNLTIRIPDGLHEELKRYKAEKKPHLSLNALIVEAIAGQLGRETPEAACEDGLAGSKPAKKPKEKPAA